MKRFFIGFLTAAGLMVPALTFPTLSLAAEKTVDLAVKNMFCASFPFIVKKTLASVEGVSKVSVSYEEQSATVTFDDSRTSVAALTEATTQAGYPSTLAGKE